MSPPDTRTGPPEEEGRSENVSPDANTEKHSGSDRDRQEPPRTVPVSEDTIPDELKAIDRWLTWKQEFRDGKWTKPPYQPNGRNAKSTDPATWTTFPRALAAYEAGRFEGIGFVLTEDDDLAGIDLDHCVEDGTVAPWAMSIVKRFGSYAEISPSGHGVRIVCRGVLPPGRRKKADREMYDSSRYLTITGATLNGSAITERQDALEQLHAEWFPPVEPDPSRDGATSDLSDAEILDLARNAANGAKFDACYRGDNSHTTDKTDSAGDLSLISMLAFYTRDPVQLDRLFRGSGRMRAKWDRADYRERTISQALETVTEQYEPAGGVVIRPPSSRPEPDRQAQKLEDALTVYRKWLHLPDADYIVCALGAVAANILDGDPLWILFVGPPGSGKTEAVQPLAGLDYVHSAATLTEPALLSGVPKRSTEKGSTGGLLRQIGDFGIILTKDFSGVLSMHRDQRQMVLSALREVFDGSWSRPVGTGGGKILDWQGKAGFIGAVTPSIDRHSAVMGALGERFVIYRLSDHDDEKATQALRNFGSGEAMRSELAEAAKTVLSDVGRHKPDGLTIEDENRLVTIAQFVVKARTAVERDGYRQNVVTLPEYEQATRLALQLAQLRAGILEVGADNSAAWRITTKVGLDSVPRLRWKILTALRDATAWQTYADLMTATGIPRATLDLHVEDLDLLNLIRREKTDPKRSNSPWVCMLREEVSEGWPDFVHMKSQGGGEQSTNTRQNGPINNPSPVWDDKSCERDDLTLADALDLLDDDDETDRSEGL